jgi:hypothetical protein
LRLGRARSAIHSLLFTYHPNQFLFLNRLLFERYWF